MLTTATLLTGLTPYTGTFDAAAAAHLLRRTTYGPTRDQIAQAVDQGLEATLDALLEDLPLPEPPLSYAPNDPNVAVGDTWVNAPYADTTPQSYRPRIASLRAWSFGRYLDPAPNIREKLVFFWHNHFVTSEVADPKFVYRYFDTLRTHALGNFRALTKAMTIDPAMLRYLNGNQNTKDAPNENYARELLELFTVGKGPQIAPGDYSNYTEDDVVAIARVLTGWRDRGFFTQNPNTQVEAFFRANQHDTGAKQLSYHFGNATINNQGPDEYAALIDLLFEQPAVATYLARKLYRYFVYYDVDASIEANVIAPLAQTLRDNDYAIAPTLRTFLGSTQFFDALNLGPMIKHPLEYLATILKTTNVALPPEQPFLPRYRVLYELSELLEEVGMPFLSPPSVAGYPAYYQEPTYYRLWVNSATLPKYTQFVNLLLSPDGLELGNNETVRIDVLTEVQALPDPSDINALIDDLTALHFPQPIGDGQRDYLKEQLIPGLPDFEWNVEYSEWAIDPDNPQLRAAIESKLRTLYTALLTMPEYYLS